MLEAVRYDEEMLAQLDGILSAASQVLDYAKEAMEKGAPSEEAIGILLETRDEMAMRLARYDDGLWVSDTRKNMIYGLEDEATTLLEELGRERETWVAPVLRRAAKSKTQTKTRGRTRKRTVDAPPVLG